MSKSPVVHFEMGFFDRERMKNFYTAAFGWHMQQLGPEMGDYVVAQTAETDEKGMVQTRGAINGGFYPKAGPQSHAPSIVISVEDIHAAMQAVVASGGKILGGMDAQGNHTMEPGMIPGIGLWIAVQDTEYNRVSLLQPNRPA